MEVACQRHEFIAQAVGEAKNRAIAGERKKAGEDLHRAVRRGWKLGFLWDL
jgi:hypothetical protein